MTDDGITLGEIARRIAADHERARRDHEALDRRITDVAARAVDGQVYASDKARSADQMESIRADIAELRKMFEAAQSRAATNRMVLISGLLFPIITAIASAVILAAVLGGR